MDPISDSAKDLSERVQVVVRCRPMSVNERQEGRRTVVNVFPSRKAIQIANPNQRTEGGDQLKTFSFDAVYGSASTQNEIYISTVAPFVASVLSGYNATIFTYGQTGAGKTYTMEGLEHDTTHKGLMPRCFDQIFDHIDQHPDDQYKVRCSYMQLYQDELIDLLGDPNGKTCLIKGDENVHIENVKSFECKNSDIMKSIMRRGSMNRKTGKTKVNVTSSRSHAIFTVTVCATSRLQGRTEVKFGKLNLVDLAGSERQKSSQSTGQLFKEATKINLSLAILGKVISALTAKKPTHIPYRDSKLTKLLRDSLGGNARTLMIANIGPAGTNYSESLNTLLYANRTKFIKNKPFTNEQCTNVDEVLDTNKLNPETTKIKKGRAMVYCRKCGISVDYRCWFCGSKDVTLKISNKSTEPIPTDSEILEKVKARLQTMSDEKQELERKMNQKVVGSVSYERLYERSYKMDLDIVMLVYRTNRYMIEKKIMDIDAKREAELTNVIIGYNSLVKERFPKNMSPELLIKRDPSTFGYNSPVNERFPKNLSPELLIKRDPSTLLDANEAPSKQKNGTDIKSKHPESKNPEPKNDFMLSLANNLKSVVIFLENPERVKRESDLILSDACEHETSLERLASDKTKEEFIISLANKLKGVVNYLESQETVRPKSDLIRPHTCKSEVPSLRRPKSAEIRGDFTISQSCKSKNNSSGSEPPENTKINYGCMFSQTGKSTGVPSTSEHPGSVKTKRPSILSQGRAQKNAVRTKHPRFGEEIKVEYINPTPSNRGQSWTSFEETNDRVQTSMPNLPRRSVVEGQRESKFRYDVKCRYNILGMKQYYIEDTKLVKPEIAMKPPLFEYLGNDRYAWYGTNKE